MLCLTQQAICKQFGAKRTQQKSTGSETLARCFSSALGDPRVAEKGQQSSLHHSLKYVGRANNNKLHVCMCTHIYV